MTATAARSDFSRPGQPTSRHRVNLRFIDWIWHVRGSLPLGPGQTREDAFARLAPLFRVINTRYETGDDTLTFRKHDQAAQDKMSIFDSGTLRIEQDVLRYQLVSRALLFCFLLPFLFVAIGQFTIVLGRFEKPAAEATAKGAKAHKPAIKTVDTPQSPIDKFLGAPAPEKPGKDGADSGKRNKKPSPTPAYVFAAIFATLYLVGRILEDRLVKTLFRKSLSGA